MNYFDSEIETHTFYIEYRIIKNIELFYLQVMMSHGKWIWLSIELKSYFIYIGYNGIMNIIPFRMYLDNENFRIKIHTRMSCSIWKEDNNEPNQV